MAGLAQSSSPPLPRTGDPAVRRHWLAPTIRTPPGSSHPQRRSSSVDALASPDASQPGPSSPSLVRFADKPTHIPSQAVAKLPPKRHSEPLRSALASSAITRRKSLGRAPPSVGLAAARAGELARRARPVIETYQRLADNSFAGRYLDHPESITLIRRARVLWHDLEAYKTFHLFDQGSFHQHFIDVGEFSAGLPSASTDAALFRDIEQSINTANRAIFAHFVWSLPQDDSQVGNGYVWRHQSLSQLKEAWRMFWRTVVPSDTASLNVPTQYLLESYLALCTQAFIAQRAASLNGSAEESSGFIASLQEFFDPEPVLSAWSYGKLAFETQTQEQQSQDTRQYVQQVWTTIAEQRARDIQSLSALGSRLDDTYTPLEAAVRLTDLVWPTFGQQRDQYLQGNSASQESQASARRINRSDSHAMSVKFRVQSWTPASLSSNSHTDSLESQGSRDLTAAERLAAIKEIGRFESMRSSQESSAFPSASIPSSSAASFSPTPIVGRRPLATTGALPFESTPLVSASGYTDESASIDSLDSEEFASQRAEWLAELIAQEESMSDSENTRTTSFSSASETAAYSEFDSEDDGSDDTVMVDLTTQERSEVLLSMVSRGQVHRRVRALPATSASLASSDETPSLDSPTRQALALPSTPERPFISRIQGRHSSALSKHDEVREHSPSPIYDSEHKSQSPPSSQSPQSRRQVHVLKLRQGRIQREAVTGFSPNILRNKAPGERLTRFGSQDTSQSDIFFQHRGAREPRLRERAPEEVAPIEQVKQQESEKGKEEAQQSMVSPAPPPTAAQRPSPQPRTTELDAPLPSQEPARQPRYRLPPSRRPRRPLLCVEIDTQDGARSSAFALPSRVRVARFANTRVRAPTVTEMEYSFSRLGVTPGAGEARADGGVAHEDVPDDFVVEEQVPPPQATRQAVRNTGTPADLSPAAQERVAELMNLEGHNPGEFEGDDDVNLRAARKQLTLEYWFARERPGLEHLPEPRSTGPVPHTQHRNPQRDVVLGVIDKQDEAAGVHADGDTLMVAISQDTEQGADETWRDGGTPPQLPETQTVDAAAAPSDSEDEDFAPSQRDARRSKSRGAASGRVPSVSGDAEAEAGGADETQDVRTSTRRRRAAKASASSTTIGTSGSKKGVGRRLASLRAAEEGAATKHWTAEETECFLSTMYQLARLKRENPHYKIYSEILSRHGKYGSESRILAARDNVALKDKARWELWRMKREGEVIPYWKHLYWSKVFEGRAPTGSRSSQMSRAAGRKKRKSGYERAETIESQPHDFFDDGEEIQTPSPRLPARGDVVRGSHDPIEELELALDASASARQRGDRSAALGAEKDGDGINDSGSDSALTSLPSLRDARSESRDEAAEVEMEVLPASSPGRRGKRASPLADEQEQPVKRTRTRKTAIARGALPMPLSART